ncbi:SH3 domain-containing protein [Streptomyces sp. B6B3]|uniref:SH3 domain-containing protein n=1 Tax=Streptomyces sp. B6B3 TaxID=3153570 RepID=UPI00325C74F2
MSMRKRALLASAAVAALVTPVVVVGAATPAVAEAACGKTAPDRDSSPLDNTAVSGGVNMRSGTSSANCPSNGVAYPSHNLDYHCYTGTEGYSWTYARNATTGVSGWIRHDLLTDQGSNVYCGF